MYDFFKKEGVILGFLTSISYVLVFRYETAYLGYFGIPSDFITIDIKTIILVIASLFSSLFVIYLLIEVANLVIPKTSIYRHHIILSMGILLFILTTLRGNRDLSTWLICLGTWALLVFVAFGAPLFKKKGKTFKEAYLEHHKKEDEIRSVYPFIMDKIIDKLFAKWGIFGGSSVMFLVWLVLVAGGFGTTGARNQSQFLVTSIDNKEYVVIKEYKDEFLVMPLEANQRVKRGFYLKSREDFKNANFNLKDIGPLELVDSE